MTAGEVLLLGLVGVALFRWRRWRQSWNNVPQQFRDGLMVGVVGGALAALAFASWANSGQHVCNLEAERLGERMMDEGD